MLADLTYASAENIVGDAEIEFWRFQAVFLHDRVPLSERRNRKCELVNEWVGPPADTVFRYD